MHKFLCCMLVIVMCCVSLGACSNEMGFQQEFSVSADVSSSVVQESISNSVSSNTNSPPAYLNSLPPESEYDELVLRDEQYCLCKKVDSGFDSNSEYYGVYDTVNQKWSIDYMELYTDDMSYFDFLSHGSGVFSYTYSSYYGTVVFLSAELGDTFKISEYVFNRDGIYFDEGQALVLLEKDNEYENHRWTPDSELLWIDVYGDAEPVSIAGFSSEEIYWIDRFLPSSKSAHEVCVRCFYAYDEADEKNTIYTYISATQMKV